jgi:hypothetical protein
MKDKDINAKKSLEKMDYYTFTLIIKVNNGILRNLGYEKNISRKEE